LAESSIAEIFILETEVDHLNLKTVVQRTPSEKQLIIKVPIPLTPEFRVCCTIAYLINSIAKCNSKEKSLFNFSIISSFT